MEKQKIKEKIEKFHDKHYKTMLILPAVIVIFCLGYMFIFYSNNHDFIYKDISLTGGTSVTIFEKVSLTELKNNLSSNFKDVEIREVSDLTTGEQKAIIIETRASAEEIKSALESYLGYKLINGENASFEITGSNLSESFYKQLLIAIFFAFILMAIVVFLLFRTFVPSLAVVVSAFADILMTLVTVNLLGIEVSSAGIIAFLMLIGYSVDTDILLTNRVLKREGESTNKKIYGAFKTGMTMTLAALFAVLSALFMVRTFSATLTQIFFIISIGLLFDVLNTWVTNVCLLKWYVEGKK